MKIFDKSEDAYIAWVGANPSGFVANVNRDSTVPQYPIAHKASHKTMWSTKSGNFTTGDYTKACSTSLEELEGYAKLKYRRNISYCGTCFRTKAATYQFVQAEPASRPRASTIEFHLPKAAKRPGLTQALGTTWQLAEDQTRHGLLGSSWLSHIS